MRPYCYRWACPSPSPPCIWCLNCLRGEHAGSSVGATIPTVSRPFRTTWLQLVLLVVFKYTHAGARKDARSTTTTRGRRRGSLRQRTGVLLSTLMRTGGQGLLSSFFGIADRRVCVHIPHDGPDCGGCGHSHSPSKLRLTRGQPKRTYTGHARIDRLKYARGELRGGRACHVAVVAPFRGTARSGAGCAVLWPLAVA